MTCIYFCVRLLFYFVGDFFHIGVSNFMSRIVKVRDGDENFRYLMGTTPFLWPWWVTEVWRDSRC